MFTMRDLASGNVDALAVADAAFKALSDSGSVHLTENVSRTIEQLRAAGAGNSPQSRALACALCAACAGKKVRHGMMPVDAASQWIAAEDAIEAWFSEPLDALPDALAKVGVS